MPHLRIQAPGQPEQLADLGEAPVVVGRDDSFGTIFVPEIKASRRHLTVRVADGDLIVRDLESSNGTWVGEQRIQRKRLREGDSFRIGDTVFTFAPGAAPTSTPLVGGTLDFVRVDGQLRRPRVAEEPAAPPAEFRPDRPPRRPVPRRDDRRSLTRVAVMLGIGAAAFAAVELVLRPQADERAELAGAHQEALTVLDAAKDGADALRTRIDEFRGAYPGAPELARLEDHLEHVQSQDDALTRARGRLQVIAGRMGDMSTSELHFDLLKLQATMPPDKALQGEVDALLDVVNRRRDQRDMEKLAAVTERVNEALEASDVPRAVLVLEAFTRANPQARETVQDGLAGIESRVGAARKAIVADVNQRAAATKGRLAHAEVLAEGVRRLDGLPEGATFAEQLRRWMRASPRPDAGATPDPSGAGTGTTPRPTIDPAVFAAAEAAEKLWRARRWSQAKEAFGKLLKDPPKIGPYAWEWRTRLSECDQMIALTDALQARLTERGPLRRKLSLGRVTLVGAKPEAAVVTKRKGEEPQVVAWGNLTDSDVLAVLAPSKPTPEQRLAVGVLAGTLGNREAFVTALTPLFTETSAPEMLQRANEVIARHLYGRADVPQGGYRAYGGMLLDEKGYQATLRREELAALRGRIETQLATLAKQSAYKKLDKLAALRDTIDKQRRYALQAIFNEKHYPYPYGNRNSPPYKYVAAEVARRVGIVRESWASPLKVRIKRSGKLGKALDDLEQALAELKRMKAPDATKWQKQADRYLLYATGDTYTIHTYYRNAKERDNFVYDEWIRAQYNPARTEYAKGEEREQVSITNDYRRMMCYSAVVKPGDAAYQAIDEGSVKAILDAGRVLKLTPLRAVRIDNRLVRSARDHSLDMLRRGYFDHHSKPDPATGRGSTAPHDRMQAAGYRGWGYSENIAVNTSALKAHLAWASSSGHHRNILSPWHDLGVGHAGKRWTQNFGSGGGARPKVYDTTEIRAPDMMSGRRK